MFLAHGRGLGDSNGETDEVAKALGCAGHEDSKGLGAAESDYSAVSSGFKAFGGFFDGCYEGAIMGRCLNSWTVYTRKHQI